MTDRHFETPITRTLIRKLEKPGPLSDAEKAALATLPVRLRAYGKGEIIVEQGESPDECALLLEGFAFRYKLLPDGQRQIVSLQVPGDFMDLHSYVLHPLDHAITAASACSVAHVAHSAVTSLLERQPRLSRPLMWDMAVDGAVTREWLANMGRRSAYGQLAHLFCEVYFRMQSAGLVVNSGFSFPLTQAELGDATGLSTVHVNRSLQGLRKDGLIIFDDQHLTVPNIDALIQAANFDPTYLHLIT